MGGAYIGSSSVSALLLADAGEHSAMMVMLMFVPLMFEQPAGV